MKKVLSYIFGSSFLIIISLSGILDVVGLVHSAKKHSIVDFCISLTIPPWGMYRGIEMFWHKGKEQLSLKELLELQKVPYADLEKKLVKEGWEHSRKVDMNNTSECYQWELMEEKEGQDYDKATTLYIKYQYIENYTLAYATKEKDYYDELLDDLGKMEFKKDMESINSSVAIYTYVNSKINIGILLFDGVDQRTQIRSYALFIFSIQDLEKVKSSGFL